MKPARLGLSPSEGRSVFFFARDCLFHAPQNQDKTGARGGPFFTGRGDPGLFAGFFFTFFSSSKILVFVFLEKTAFL
jgi:hypothetical protein